MKSFLLGLLAVGFCYTANAQTSKEDLQQAKIDSLTTIIQDLQANQQDMQKQIETVDKNSNVWRRGKYRNFSFNKEKIEVDGFDGSIESEWGAAITMGKTYYLHKTPILSMIKIGLDWTYFDINAAGYKMENYEEGGKDNAYHFTAGMQIGPSVTVNPVDQLTASVYFRYAPSYSGIYANDDYHSGGYATFFVSGLSVSYRVISLGVEKRWGTVKYDLDDTDEKIEYNISGPRFYIGFRF
jgi:hypothetical protein